MHTTEALNPLHVCFGEFPDSPRLVFFLRQVSVSFVLSPLFEEGFFVIAHDATREVRPDKFYRSVVVWTSVNIVPCTPDFIQRLPRQLLIKFAEFMHASVRVSDNSNFLSHKFIIFSRKPNTVTEIL